MQAGSYEKKLSLVVADSSNLIEVGYAAAVDSQLDVGGQIVFKFANMVLQRGSKS